MNKETYRINREAGKRGQGEYPNVLVGYTSAADVIQGVPGTRKARRAVEAHGVVRKLRTALRGIS
jgi:hypothetical protein